MSRIFKHITSLIGELQYIALVIINLIYLIDTLLHYMYYCRRITYQCDCSSRLGIFYIKAFILIRTNHDMVSRVGFL